MAEETKQGWCVKDTSFPYFNLAVRRAAHVLQKHSDISVPLDSFSVENGAFCLMLYPMVTGKQLTSHPAIQKIESTRNEWTNIAIRNQTDQTHTHTYKKTDTAWHSILW